MKDILIEIIQKMNPFDEFDEDTDLFDEGLMDSLTIVGMISEFENSTGCIIPSEMVTIDVFTSVNSIVSELKKREIYKD